MKDRGEEAPSRLLSIKELSDFLQVPVSTIYDWRYRREAPKAIKVGKFLRFDVHEVMKWLERRSR
jgi:excisionase family DNA binding protein